MKRELFAHIEDATTVLHHDDLQVDLEEVELIAFQELLSTRTRGVGIHTLMDAMLIDGDRLIWRGRGFGNGIEMRRAISGLFGRFFSRWLAQTHLGFQFLTPISGSPHRITSLMSVVRARTSKCDLPDWIGRCSGQAMFCEAKGSSAHNIGRSSALNALKTAKKQLSNGRVRIARTGGDKGLPGWAIMSRWGVENPRREPLILAKDPEPEKGDLLDADQEQEVYYALIQAERRNLLYNMGLQQLASHYTETALQSEEYLRTNPNRQSTLFESQISGGPEPMIAKDSPEVALLRTEKETREVVGRLISFDGRPIDLTVKEAASNPALDETCMFVGFESYALDDDVAALARQAEARAELISINHAGDSGSRNHRGMISDHDRLVAYTSPLGFSVARPSALKDARTYQSPLLK